MKEWLKVDPNALPRDAWVDIVEDELGFAAKAALWETTIAFRFAAGGALDENAAANLCHDIKLDALVQFLRATFGESVQYQRRWSPEWQGVPVLRTDETIPTYDFEECRRLARQIPTPEVQDRTHSKFRLCVLKECKLPPLAEKWWPKARSFSASGEPMQEDSAHADYLIKRLVTFHGNGERQ